MSPLDKVYSHIEQLALDVNRLKVAFLSLRGYEKILNEGDDGKTEDFSMLSFKENRDLSQRSEDLEHYDALG